MPTCVNCQREADFSYEVNPDNVLHYCEEHLPSFTRKGANATKLVDLSDAKARAQFDADLAAQQADEAVAKSKKKTTAEATAEAPVDPAGEPAPEVIA